MFKNKRVLHINNPNGNVTNPREAKQKYTKNDADKNICKKVDTCDMEWNKNTAKNDSDRLHSPDCKCDSYSNYNTELNIRQQHTPNSDKSVYNDQLSFTNEDLNNTVLHINEDNIIGNDEKPADYGDSSSIFKSGCDFNGEFLKCEDVDDDFNSLISDGNEQTTSLLCKEDNSDETEHDLDRHHKKASRKSSLQSICNNQRRNSHQFIDMIGRKLSMTQDATENVFHKILENHLEKYEEIPMDEKTGKIKHRRGDSTAAKTGQILTTNSTTNSNHARQPNKRRCCGCCGPKTKLIFGILSFLFGIITFIYTPEEFLMKERLRMTPGLPAFDWWLNPPDDVFLNIYVFNVTNSEQFLKGIDTKLAISEIGPIVFKEKLRHSNVSFNPNDTLTYIAKRWVELLPDLNKIDLNTTIIVPNLPVLGFASYLYDYPYLIKKTLEFMMASHRSKLFIEITIYDYLFNFSDPLLKTASDIVPGIVPMSNMGMLSSMYMVPSDQVTVFIGSRWGDSKFFTFDNFNGNKKLPAFLKSSTCKETVEGATEGLIYTQRLSKNTTLLYWRKSLCKVMKLYYVEDIYRKGILAYKFAITNTTYHRTFNESNPDCFTSRPTLLNGLSDISKCFFDFPMAISLPHFLGTDPSVFDNIDGLSPDPAIHHSFTIIEPSTGIPLESAARSQINLVMRPLRGFRQDIQRFSNKTIPMFWAEYIQLDLPYYIWGLIITQVKVVPVVQVLFSTTMVILGVYLFYSAFDNFFVRLCCPSSFKQQKNINHLARNTRNTIFSYDHEKTYVSS